MKEPKKIPLDPETPQAASVEKIPMPSIYPEAMSNDVYSAKKDEEVKKYPLNDSVEKELHNLIEDSKQYLSKKEATLNFIEKVKQSKKKYNERLEKGNKDST